VDNNLGLNEKELTQTITLEIPLPLERVAEIIEQAWNLVRAAHSQKAYNLSQKLVYILSNAADQEEPTYLYNLAHAHYTAGYIAAISTFDYEAHIAIEHFQTVEEIARLINNQILLNIALTYQGNIHRRLGNLDKAKDYLEAARDTTSPNDYSVQGNNLQLLGRVYALMHNYVDFDRTIKAAENLATLADQDKNIMHGQYCLGTVYEEYARFYGDRGQLQMALDYLDKAKNAFPPTKHWAILLKTTEAVSLIKGGETDLGTQTAIEAAHLCQYYGNIRLLERIIKIQGYLEKKSLEMKRSALKIESAINDYSSEIPD
jgi:tetratricopeptide (TPR) repeat protein